MDDLILVPLIIAITEALKTEKYKRFIPIVSILSAVILKLAIAILNQDFDFIGAINGGLIIGLGACGLYSGSKTLIKSNK